jgi:hypothetical protein
VRNTASSGPPTATAGDLDPENRGACDPAFPRTDAVWAVRPRRSYVTLTACDFTGVQVNLDHHPERNRHDEEEEATG